MKQLKIYINDELLEVDDTPAYMSFSVSDFLTDFSIISNKTNVLKIPATPYNSQVLGRMQELNTTGFVALTALVESDGFQFTGKCIVNPATFDGRRWWFNIQIIGGNGDWIKQLEGELLKDTDLSDLEHTLTATNVKASESGTKDYIYDLIDRGQEQFEGRFMLIDRYPAVRLSKIVKAMFQEKGIKLVSNFMADPYFTKKFLMFTQDNDILKVPSYSDEQIYNTDIFTEIHTQSVASGQQTINPFGGYTFLQSAVYYITPEQVVNHRFRTSIKFRYYRPNTNVIFVCGGGFPGCGSNVTIAIYKGATLLKSSTFNYTESFWNTYVTTTVETDFVKFNTGDSVIVQISVTGYFKNLTASPISVNFEVNQTVGNYLRNFVSAWFYQGETVTFDHVLPQDMTKLDFLKWIADKYDLLFAYNPEQRTLYCEQRRNFYATEAQEWTNLINLDADIQIEHTIQPENNLLECKYTQDGNDKSQYLNRKNEVYRTSIGNVFTQPGIEYINLKDSDTMFARSIRLGLSNTYIPVLWTEGSKKSDTWLVDGSLIYPEQQTKFNLRVLDFAGFALCGSGDAYYFENIQYSGYPKFEREPIADLVATNWDYRIRLLKEAKRLVVNVLLTDSQVNRIRACVDGYDLRSPVIVRLAGIADSLFTIERIEDFNLSKKEPTKVYLVEAFINTTTLTGLPTYYTTINTTGDRLLINDNGDFAITRGSGSQDPVIYS